MDDSDNSYSISSKPPDAPDFLDSLPHGNEIVEDLTGEKALLDDQSSQASLGLHSGALNIKPRSYQIEMLEESIEKNIIVAMDTGSGKTHIAVLRMLHELEHMPSHQLIWFLAPTVALCSQQFDYIKSQISSVQVKFLSGADGVDRWTEQSLWSSVLKNVKIVVSTYQILLDALTHGFVKIESLALIVLDEAHNCVRRHPGAKIMRTFYHPQKFKGLSIPHILGLTASPVMRSDPQSVETIEKTLDSICRTPNKHRAELRLQVKLPTLSQKFYQTPPPLASLTSLTRTIKSLGHAYRSLNIAEDPQVLSLMKQTSEKSMRKLDKVRLNHKTWCQDQMKSLYATSLKIAADLGAWSADYYISEIISKFTAIVNTQDNYQNPPGDWNISNAERRYLTESLKTVDINTADAPISASLTSDKVYKLIEILLQESTDFAGIVFVQERATVAVLAQLLSVHPDTRGKFRIGTIVGSSMSSHRTHNIGELVDVDDQEHTLSLFKIKVINLLIATSVLEEGIDIAACNLVICFQKPANLKSFVQRRGRARQRESKLVLLLDSEVDKLSEWQQLELDMKKIYENEMRALQEVLVYEDTEPGAREFRVESTGAVLDLDNAVQHLFHFCATLPSRDYVDLRPDFICFKTDPSLIRARAILPLSAGTAVRIAESRTTWKSERNAIKDAAYEAYIALYKAGLVNQNLLPLLGHDPIPGELRNSAVETRANVLLVNEQLNPWIEIARLWKAGHQEIKRFAIHLNGLKMWTYLPKLPRIAPFQVFWDLDTDFPVTITPEHTILAQENLSKAIDDTWSILQSSFGIRFPIQKKQHILLLSPSISTHLKDQLGRSRISEQGQQHLSGLIREISNRHAAYIYKDRLAAKPPRDMVQRPYENYDQFPSDAPHLSLIRLPKRFDYLRRITAAKEQISVKPYSVVLPISKCTMDEMSFPYVQFGLLIPSIMRRLEIYVLADKLSSTVLKPVGFQNIDLVVKAISASSAMEDSNYQRLEFIGDSFLKLCTSIQLTAEYPLWHEGYLSAMKDRLVSNSRLCRAAIDTGLDNIIVTKAFNGHKWRPSYVDDLLQISQAPKREISSKVLADVVEALIGAATIDGGIPKGLVCLQVFLPELVWLPLETRQMSMFQRAPEIELPPTLEALESLVGYKFQKKSLLVEAVTHASCNSGNGSLERLEFLGDSILDTLVVSTLQLYKPELSHVQMHLMRTALVNADFLAFLCMELATEQQGTDIIEVKLGPSSDGTTTTKFVERAKPISFPLWSFMRHQSPTLGQVQRGTALRHAQLRDQINATIQTGSHYPWALLSRLQAFKFYSDMVESLLGAIWIDSGSFEVCKSVIERMGILPYLRRILKESIHIWHPKEELGQLAITQTVRYVIGLMRPEQDGTAAGVGTTSGIAVGGGRYWCRILLGEREIVAVDDGVSKLEAQTRAAELAVSILKAEKLEQVMSGSGVVGVGTQDEQHERDVGMVMDM